MDDQILDLLRKHDLNTQLWYAWVQKYRIIFNDQTQPKAFEKLIMLCKQHYETQVVNISSHPRFKRFKKAANE